MNRRHLSVLLLVLVGLLSPRLQGAVDVGDKPAMQFKSTTGQTVDLQDLRGKLVLVDFWATWCGPCMAEAEHMVQVNRQYGPKGLVLIGISLDSNRGALNNVVKQKGFIWPQQFDGQGWNNRFAKEWGVRGIPRTFLIGPDGAVLWVGHPARMDAAIEKAFAEHPPVLVDPAVVAEANSLLDQAEAALAEPSGYTDGLKLLGRIPADAAKDAATAERLKQLQSRAETAAEALLAEVDPMIQSGQYVEAAARLRALSEGLARTPAGAKAKQKLGELLARPEARQAVQRAEASEKADAALQVAEQLKSDGKHEQAYARYKAIAKDFPGTGAAATAEGVVKEYENDPAFVSRAAAAADAAAATKAKAALSMAENYRRVGKPELAKKKYQEVIDQFPGTSFAEAAKKELAKLR